MTADHFHNGYRNRDISDLLSSLGTPDFFSNVQLSCIKCNSIAYFGIVWMCAFI